MSFRGTMVTKQSLSSWRNQNITLRTQRSRRYLLLVEFLAMTWAYILKTLADLKLPPMIEPIATNLFSYVR
jgi:hypothetical protein